MSPTASVEEGARRLQAGDVQGAITILQQATAADPGDARAHGLLGVACARAGDLPASIASFQTVAQLQPTDAGARFNLANALYQANRYQEARAVADAALALNPAHENARQLIARIDAAAQPAATTAPASWSPASVGTAAPLTGPTTAPDAGAAPPAPPGAVPWATGPASPPPSPPGAGMQYQPQAVVQTRDEPPGTGLRIARGLGWGALFGQWWTLWTIVSMFLWGHAPSGPLLVIAVVIYGFIYAFAGALAGLVIAVGNLDPDSGQAVGIGVGVLVCVAEVLLEGSAALLVNLIFYFFTGRFIGRGIAARVQQPVRR